MQESRIGTIEIQRDLGRFMRYDHLERSHPGYRLRGRTPVQALMEALTITEIPNIVPAEEVNAPLPTAAWSLSRSPGLSGKYTTCTAVAERAFLPCADDSD